ncbi:MAG: nucleotidyltransferase substrate binding protein [Deltaproteobacteria bacterium]|nr:nucleotidyltransferase substrate binding protein [Deltaproteobacteria bacterium]
MPKVDNKLANLEKGLASLVRFTGIEKPSEVERAGIIQAFEYSYELIWRALKAYAEDQGLSAPSPRSAFKAGFQLGVIREEKIWLDVLEARNLTTHTYQEDVAKDIYERVVKKFVPEFKNVLAGLKNRARQ